MFRSPLSESGTGRRCTKSFSPTMRFPSPLRRRRCTSSLRTELHLPNTKPHILLRRFVETERIFPLNMRQNCRSPHCAHTSKKQTETAPSTYEYRSRHSPYFFPVLPRVWRIQV